MTNKSWERRTKIILYKLPHAEPHFFVKNINRVLPKLKLCAILNVCRRLQGVLCRPEDKRT